MQKILLVSLILFSSFTVGQEIIDKDMQAIKDFSEKIKSTSESSSATYAISSEDRLLFDRKSKPNNFGDIQIPENLHKDVAEIQAKQILSKAIAPVMDKPLNNINTSKPNTTQVLIFVSWSMGSAAVKQLLAEASEDQSIVLVFRGVKKVEDMTNSLKEISALASQFNPVPRVMLNPTFFHKFNISQVPSVVLYDEQNDKLIGKVVGLSDPIWLSRKVKESKEIDFGIKGPAIAIGERDIIEVMKERVMNIDWAKKKEAANLNFWKKQQFINLPRATKSLSRALDPSIQVTDDILDGEGKILVKSGTIINPLDLKSFDKTIIIFDPLDKSQLSVVKERNAELTKKGKPVMLLATQFDRSKNWDSYKEITQEFNAPVFKLTSDVQSRFLINVVPSIVTADKKSFYIEEINVSSGH